MAFFKFNNIQISALAACVPAETIENDKALRGILSAEEIKKTINAVGIKTRRVCGNACEARDLCRQAAKTLFEKNAVSPDSVDVLLYLSQSNTRRIPATATLLHRELALSENCAAIDLSLGCSGYIFALASAFSWINAGAKRVLLLCGDALSKFVDPADRVNLPLYGDAGTATLVEAGENAGESVFSLNTDGSGNEAVKTLPDGKIFMDGMEVFNFAIKRVPAAVKSVCAVPAEADWLVFHQANKMMTDFLAARLRVPAKKLAYSLERFGNVSAPSIPLTVCDCLAGEPFRGNVVFCGFGAGLSWGAAKLSLAGTHISKPVIYQQNHE